MTIIYELDLDIRKNDVPKMNVPGPEILTLPASTNELLSSRLS